MILGTWGQVEAQQREIVHHPAGLTRLVVQTPGLIVVEGGSSGDDGDDGDGDGDGGGEELPDEPAEGESAQVRPSQDDQQFVYRPAGRFQLWTGGDVAGGGNPLIAGDENRVIASLSGTGRDWDLTDFTSLLTVSVDGQTYDPYDLMYNQDPQSDPADLPVFWPQPLSAGTRDAVGEVLVPLDTDVPTEGQPNVRVRINYLLVHDGLMLDYIVYNDDSVAHSIGLRMLIDALFGAGMRDGRQIILDDGTVITTETRIPDPDNSTIAMPDTWVAYDDPSSPLVSVRGTISGREVTDAGIASASAGEPDEIAFGQRRNMGNVGQFEFQPNPAASLIGEDWAYAVKWEERTLQAGQSRRYVTYYGLGAAAVDYDAPYALAAYAPTQLEVREGDDPTTSATENYYLAEPGGEATFDIVTMIDNFAAASLNNASVRLSLPQGLELYPETQPRTVSLGLVTRNQTPLPRARWTVRATAARPGTAKIRVTGPLGKTVTRQISIPAVPVIGARDSVSGLEMLSIPYSFANSDASNVFGSLSDSVYPGGPVGLWRWDPAAGQYASYPDPFVANIEVGEGLWLENQNQETITLPMTATAVSTAQPYTVSLAAGWNQIGNPFVVPVRFDQVGVIGPQGSQWTITEATQRGLILPVLYAYDPEANEYTWETSLSTAQVVPFEGYWLLAYRDVSLVFPTPSLYSPAASGGGEAVADQDAWRVGLEVECDGQTRSPRYLAVAEGAEDGMDTTDVPAPPAVMSADTTVDAYFTVGEGERAAHCLMDSRSAELERNTWDLTVVAEEPGAPVSIRWPDLSSELPEGLVATLEDLETGRRVFMRTNGSYTFRSRTGGERHLQVTVRPRAETMLGLSATTQAVEDGGVEIVYSLAAEAEVDVEVRNIAGRVVRRVAVGQVAEEGQNTLVWNGVSDAGTVVPGGTYIMQVTARSMETGEQMSVIRTATIAR